MPLADLQSLHALYPEIAVYFGECRVANFSANSPEVKAASKRPARGSSSAYVPGAEHLHARRLRHPVHRDRHVRPVRHRAAEHELPVPDAAAPRRVRRAADDPARHPGEPVPCCRRRCCIVPSAQFPLKASYSTTLGDPCYRVHAVVGGGHDDRGRHRGQVYDLDTNRDDHDGTTTVPTTGGPTTADSSLQHAGRGLRGRGDGDGQVLQRDRARQHAQKVQWPGTTYTPSGTQPFTAECWFKRSRIGQTEAVFVQWCDGLTSRIATGRSCSTGRRTR
jgi:hypothetical protein